MGNLDAEAAQKKLASLLYISIGSTGRKTLMDTFPHIRILTTPLQEVLRSCEECLRVRRNRTNKFLSKKQNNNESMHQYWIILNGLAAKCDFGERTEGLVDDIFILKMSDKQMQKKL